MGESDRILIETGQNLPEMSWAGELAQLTDAWPYVCPAFLAATERAMPEIKPFHTMARRARGELAILPGYVLDAPSTVDHDPRTYLGWQPPSGDEACCGGDLACGHAAEVDAIGAEAFFPCLLLGSPLGYRTEVAYNFWTRDLFGQLVAHVVRAALEAGLRTVAVPWVSGRAANADLVSALVSHGAHSAFWGYEDFITVRADNWDAHLSALPIKIRQRITGDQRRANASGVRITRVDGEQIRPHIPRIAELICLNREKYGGDQEPAQVQTVLTGMLDAGADIRAYLGFANSCLVGCCVALSKAGRLFPKWAGFDYQRLGERSGLYFALGLDAPIRDALAEGMRAVEFGPGAHQAKKLRGCSSRAVTTALLMADKSLRPAAARLQDAFGEARHAAFGDHPATHTPLQLVKPRSSACCSAG